ncbi:MAG TPA: hypothetical protein VJI15_03170 [Candidatus Nanoarchaeia archaeon]|nr:hypothetical protein [Candidatus Nanoarchaeia archaeon]
MPPDYLISKENALKQYAAADHLLRVTFPLVKDKALFLAIIHHLLSSLENAVEAMILYDAHLHSQLSLRKEEVVKKELLKKEVSFQRKIAIFRENVMKRYKISPEFTALALDLQRILVLHKKSPMAFRRGTKFVVCTDDYRLRIISEQDIREYVAKTSQFLRIMGSIVTVKKRTKKLPSDRK